MQKGCWKVDENDEAVYIDIEDDAVDPNKEYSAWPYLPDLLLEKIFSYLTIREKYYASLVCKSWHDAFYLPYVWSRFVLEEETLTRGRFNYYSGWQYVLDHLRTSMCFSQVGRHFRTLIFEPMLNFYNLYEFMNMLSWYIEQSKASNEEEGIGCKITSLKYTFPCNMASRDETERIRLFGTGGKLLEGLKRLMRNLKLMERLELIDLMLDSREAQHLLDEVCEICCLSLRKLVMINTTRTQCPLLHVGVFLNLQVLVISPQNLGDDVVELLGFTNLRHLHILQNRYTPNDPSFKPVCAKSWKLCRKYNPYLSVHLEVEGTREKELIWQPGAPVTTIIFDSPHIKLIRERISTATVLLIAHTAKNLRYLFVRRNAVILKCDWPKNAEWSDEFYAWLRISSRSYETTETEVSQILGYKWKMSSDKEFLNTKINMFSEY